MLGNKAKEQLIAIITLGSFFIFFLYLKLNPEIAETQQISEQNSNIEEIMIEKEIINNNIQEFIADDSNSKINESIILFSENEIKRAKSYLDRDWKPDDTINMAAWEYVLKNPNINSNISDKIQVVNTE